MPAHGRVDLAGAPFGLGRFLAPAGEVFLGMVLGDRVARVDKVLPGRQRLEDLLTDWDASISLLEGAAGSAAGDAALPTVALEALDVLAPVTPRQVFQSGANYASHVIDLMVARHRDEDGGADLEQVRAEAAAVMEARAANDQPYVFVGLPSAICGPYDDVVLPRTGLQHDWELELAAVIARPTYDAVRASALGSVAGYLVVNDVTTRDRVFRPDLPGIGSDWLAAKNAPTFLPTGPVVVPACFVDDPQQLRVRLALNGEVMQDASTSDMIFGVARLIEHASSLATMLPGDLLLTGSPAGNGAHHGRFLRAGDVMEGGITGLGTQRNACVARAGP